MAGDASRTTVLESAVCAAVRANCEHIRRRNAPECNQQFITCRFPDCGCEWHQPTLDGYRAVVSVVAKELANGR